MHDVDPGTLRNTMIELCCGKRCKLELCGFECEKEEYREAAMKTIFEGKLLGSAMLQDIQTAVRKR